MRVHRACFCCRSPQQFYHSPAKTYWIKSGGAGEKYQGFSHAPRNPLFGLVAHDPDPDTWRALWSDLTLAFGDPDDTFRLRVRNQRWCAVPEDAAAAALGGVRGYRRRSSGWTRTCSAAAAVMWTRQCDQPHWYGDPATAIVVAPVWHVG